jgi:hypothetical protein
MMFSTIGWARSRYIEVRRFGMEERSLAEGKRERGKPEDAFAILHIAFVFKLYLNRVHDIATE